MNLKSHLKSRYLNIDLHKPILDYNEKCATFILYNMSGNLVGYHQYRPLCDKKCDNNPKNSRYYTYKKQPTIAVWGIESYYISDGPIFITEGLFDAARLTNKNQTAFAVLCNKPSKDYYNWFKSLTRPIVVVCDNDSAGKELSNFGDYVHHIQDFKDLGDASDDYVNYLISKYKMFDRGHFKNCP